MRTRSLHATPCLVMLLLAGASRVSAREVFPPPDPKELAMTQIAFAPGAPAAVLELRTDHDDVSRSHTEYHRIKVLTHEGESCANVEIPYDASKASLSGIHARTVHPDGSIAEFQGAVNDRVLLRHRHFRLMAKTFTAPQVGPGSIVEYTFTLRWARDAYEPTVWQTQGDLPTLHERLTMKPLPYISCFYTYNGLPPGSVPVYEKDHYVLDLQDLPAYEPEPMSESEAVAAPYVRFYYTLGRLDKPEDYWANMAGAMSSVIEKFIGDRSEIRDEAAKIIAGSATAEEKVRRLFARAREVRNTTLPASREARSADENKREVKSALDVLKNGYGSGFDINAFFIALARSAGFAADPVFISSRSVPFSRKAPLWSQLQDVAVVVTVDGAQRYVDPGFPVLPFGMLDEDNSGVAALQIPKKGPPVWDVTPVVPAAKSVARRTADLKLDANAVTGTLRVELTGLEAVEPRARGWEDDEAANRKAVENDVKEMLPAGSTVELTAMNGFRDSESPIVLDFRVTIPGVAGSAGARTLLPLSLLSANEKNPFTAPTRKRIIVLGHPSSIEDSITIHLPSGLEIDTLPKPVSIVTGPLSWKSTANAESGAIRFTRSFVQDLAFVPVHQYDAYRAFRRDAATADATAAATLRSK